MELLNVLEDNENLILKNLNGCHTLSNRDLKPGKELTKSI